MQWLMEQFINMCFKWETGYYWYYTIWLYFKKADFEKLLETEHWLCFIYMKILENILLERENRSFLLQHSSASDRFKLFMETDYCAQRYLQEVPQKIVAQYLSMAPETYSKVKKIFSKTLMMRIMSHWRIRAISFVIKM